MSKKNRNEQVLRSAKSAALITARNYKERRPEIKYGFSKKVTLTYEQAIDKVIEELKKEGFGVLSTIDVKETLKKKLNVDFKKYVILGACNPAIAHKALLVEEQIGLLLPCNVVVYEEKDSTVVGVFDPMTLLEVVENEALGPVADEVRRRLVRVIERM